MNRKAQALRLAAASLANGVLSDEAKLQVLAAAQAAGVNTTDYLHALSILKTASTELISMEVSADEEGG